MPANKAPSASQMCRAWLRLAHSQDATVAVPAEHKCGVAARAQCRSPTTQVASRRKVFVFVNFFSATWPVSALR